MQRALLSLCVITIMGWVGVAGFSKTAQAQIVLDETATETEVLPPDPNDVTAATFGTNITQLRTFSGKVDYAVIGKSFTSSEISCDNLGSRSATLMVPAGSTIRAAYLYWAGSGSSVDSTVSFNGQSIGAQKTWQDSFVNGPHTMYYFGARAEVTHLVSGSNTYTVSGLSYNAGSPYCSTYGTLGNWALVVVYENNSAPDQIVNLYDGFQGEFRGPHGTSNSTTLTHLLPVNIPGGCAQAVQLIHVSHEGDNYKGENLYINNANMGGNTYNGSTAPNLDIDSYNITSLVGTGPVNINFTTQNYYTNGAQEAYFNNVFVVKYRSCVPPTPTNTPIPPTATPTNTPVPPTATPTNTPVPPTATNTPVPPTATPTNTAVPPTATNTAVPPTATNTAVPPTATNTAVPPTATATNTPAPLGSIGNKIWRDENGNGVLDNNEPGVPNVTVQLKDCSGNLLGTRTTDANGFYGFNNLPAGCYIVAVVLPSGYSYSPLDQGGNDSIDSDINPTTGMTAPINLAAGQNLFTIDAGLVPVAQPTPTNTAVPPTATATNTAVPPTATATNTPAPLGSIGNRVWRDQNGNGVLDNNEPGVPNVTVQLKDCSGNLLGTRTTDANGFYGFNNLPAGCYIVGVVLPSGFNYSPLDQGGNDSIDSDINPANGMTAPINLGAGQNLFTIDAGLVPVAQPTPTPTNTPVGPTPTPTNTPAGPTPTPTPQVGGPVCYDGPCPDTDNDGLPDYLDEDDDNDGIPSVDEDANGNGFLEDDDSDNDGIPDYLDPRDSDNDTVPDPTEDVNRNGNLNDDDTDGDGTPNYLDTDSDNDGIGDKREAGSVPSFPYDADGDGTPDYLDTDSDNDGKSDATEGTGSDDGDGIPDYLDPQDDGPGSGDSDNDGVPDAVECPPSLLGATMPDVDLDGVPDYLDTDLVSRFYLPLIGRQ